jgi:hypothetical protein
MNAKLASIFTLAFFLAMLMPSALSTSISANRTSLDKGQRVFLNLSASGGVPPYYLSLTENGTYIFGGQGTVNTTRRVGYGYSYQPIYGPKSYGLNYTTQQLNQVGILNFTLRATDSTGLNASNTTIQITVNRPLNASLNLINTSVIYNTSSKLLAKPIGGTAPYNYSWFNSSCGSPSGRLISYNSSYVTNIINQTKNYCLVIKDNSSEVASATTILWPVSSITTSSGLIIRDGSNGQEIFPPSIYETAKGVIATNVTYGDIFDVGACGFNRTIIQEALSPNQSVIGTNGSITYKMLINQTIQFNNTDCYIKLLNVSWAPILHSTSYLFYQGASTTTTSIPQNPDLGTLSTSTYSSSTSSTTTIQASNVINKSQQSANSIASKPATKHKYLWLYIVIFVIAAGVIGYLALKMFGVLD